MLQVGRDERRNIVALKREPHRERFVKNATERIKIGAVIHREAAELLRRNGVDRPGDGPRVIHRLLARFAHHFGQTEIEQLGLEASRGRAGQHDIGRLDVAVDHPDRMGGGESLEALLGEGREKLQVHRLGEFVQVLTRDIFHHDKDIPVGAEEIINHHDVLVLQAGQLTGLAEGVGDAAIGLHPLDRHPAVQNRIVAQVNGPAPADSDSPVDRVASVPNRCRFPRVHAHETKPEFVWNSSGIGWQISAGFSPILIAVAAWPMVAA